MEVRRLSKALAAEVRGIDLRQELSAEQVQKIYDTWLEHQVLVFPNQVLSAEDQTRFTRHFGELQLSFSPIRHGAAVNYIGNGIAPDGKPGARGDGIFEFHQDGVYREKPTKMTMLYSLAIPSKGGNTLFGSTYGAYEALSPDLRDRCADLKVVHNFYKTGTKPDERQEERYTHPLVVAHAETGRPLLMCDREMSESIVGLPKAESDELLEKLCDLLGREDNVYAHEWRLNDLVLWDNLATAHARTDFDPSEPRMMQRTTVMGEKPAAYRCPAKATA